jgi:hypothetical protein
VTNRSRHSTILFAIALAIAPICFGCGAAQNGIVSTPAAQSSGAASPASTSALPATAAKSDTGSPPPPPSLDGAKPAAPLLTGVWIHDQVTISAGDPYGSQLTASGALGNFKAMKADGITSVACDCFTNVGYLQNSFVAAHAVGLQVAPEIDLSAVRAAGDSESLISMWARAAIADYAATFGKDAAAAKTPDGRLIVWVNGTADLTATAWSKVASGVQASGVKVYLVGDDRAASGGWDATWSFEPGATRFATTLMPAYTRTAAASPLPPDRGVRYVAQWKQAIAASAPAVDIESWNAAADGTSIAGNRTLEQETAKYASLYLKPALTAPAPMATPASLTGSHSVAHA